MTIFGVEFEKSKRVEIFIKDVDKRLHSNNMVKNPFVGYAFTLSDKVVQTAIIKMRCIYPQLLYVGFTLLGIILYFTKFRLTYWLLICIPLFLFAGLNNKYWFYAVMVRGLKSKGYSGHVKLLSDEEVKEVLALKCRNI